MSLGELLYLCRSCCGENVSNSKNMLKENRVIVAEGGPTLPTRMYEVELFKTIESYVKR